LIIYQVRFEETKGLSRTIRQMFFTSILNVILFACFGFIFGMLTGLFGVGGGFLMTASI